MSSNQSKSDKSEQHYRKTGRSTRFNRKRTTSGDNGKGAGGLPAPSPSPSSNRSFKKSINVQGGQSKVTSPAVNSSNAPSVSNVQNGPHVQPPIHANASPAVSPLESATSQRSTRAVPKAPTYQPATVSSDSTFPTTPSKASGDASKAFSVQFGSQSPGFMNGMQVSVRSSSAPPNLDEQKPAQARHDSSFRYVPKMPTPVPKQQQPKKDSVPTVQSDFGEAHPMPKVKKDAQAFVASPTKQTEKPSHPMPMPFHKQQQVSMQLGGPNPQFQSPASIQLPIHVPLPMGNASLVQQQVLVPGLQAHPLPPQRMMHQGQSLNFLPSIGGQLPLHLGNMGMGIAPRYHPNVQFGSISPGFMNGMQIPPRTSSASPNLYEQKCAQARHDSSLRSIPDTPTRVPKQPQPRKDSVPTVQSNSGEAHPEPKVKKDAQASVASPTKKTQKQSHPMQIPFHHQQQVPMQFGGPNPQIQSPASIQMPMHMPLTLGNAPQVQQQVRVPGLQSHQLPPQGMMHQGQGLSFSPPLGGQLPPHLGNAGMGIVPQYPQQQGGNFGVPRKTTPVKITHPNTREELRLDKRTYSYSDGAPSGPGSHPNVLSQSQPIPSFGLSHSINYYSNSMFYPPPSALPFSSSQIAYTAQGPGFNYPVSHSHQNMSFMNSAAAHGSVPGNKSVKIVHCTSESPNSLPAVEKVRKNKKEKKRKKENFKDLDACQSRHENAIESEKIIQKERKEKNTTRGQDLSEPTSKYERSLVPSSKDKPVPELSRTESNTTRGKKKRKEFLRAKSKSVVLDPKHTSCGSPHKDDIESEKNAQNKAIPDDWEDSADISALNLGTLESDEKAHGVLVYSRDFLLKFAEKCTDLPYGFEIDTNFVKIFMIAPEFVKTFTVAVEKVRKNKKKNKKSKICDDLDACQSRHENAIDSEKNIQNKVVPDDWEDSADISILNLGNSETDEKAHGVFVNHEKDGSGNIAKKYSRDFLKFAEQCTDLPHGFEIDPNFVKTFMITTTNFNASHFVGCNSHNSPGRILDRQFSGSRQEFCASGMVGDDRMSTQPGSFGSGRDPCLDLGFGTAAGFRPAQGGNFGALRHPRGQAPLAYIGGILGSPMQPMGPQGGIPCNIPDSNRWQRATIYQQMGLLPSPQTPLQMMHKAERKCEVCIVAGEDESKQRQLKAILNKLTPQNFEKLFEQVKAVNIDNAVTLNGVISQIFDKALMEPTFCEMYANFCYHLAGELPYFSEDNEKITFKKLLLNKCQEEFERGQREQEEANKIEEDGELKQSEEEIEEKRIKARRRMLGNIRLIGELYKKKMLAA